MAKFLNKNRLGLLLSILVLTTMSSCTSNDPPKTGRYQIFFSPYIREDTFLVDTEKGRVWRAVRYIDVTGKPTVWEEIDIIDRKGEIGTTLPEWVKTHP